MQNGIITLHDMEEKSTFFPIECRKYTVQNSKEKTNFIKSACSTFLKGKSLKSFSLMNPSILVVCQMEATNRFD